MSVPSLSGPEAEDITFEKLLNGQVSSYTVRKSARATVDKFVSMIRDEQQSWDDDIKIVYYLFDFSQNFAGFNTPYANQKMREMLDWRPELVSYSAIVVPNSFMVQIARIFLNRMHHKKTHTQLCFSREEAINWLSNMIASNHSAADMTVAK